MVHFAVGMSMGLLLLIIVDFSPRVEFGLIIASGFWAVIPDGHWIVLEMGFPDIAALWKAFHQTTWANLFWFHRVLDRFETGQNTLEGSISLGILLFAAIVYLFFNNWPK